MIQCARCANRGARLRKGDIMAAPTINADECSACGSCVEACPSGVLEMGDVAKVANPDDCVECGACVEECPVGAITL